MFSSLVNSVTSAIDQFKGQDISPTDHTTSDSNPLDKTWAKTAFMVSDQDLADSTDIKNRYWSSASAKFTDGRLGCNIGINPRPQWTRYSDIRVKGRFKNRENVSVSNVSGNYGMGRAYSEGIDDPAQKIFLRFGVPQYNSLSTFLLRAFDREQTILARTGRAPTAFYTLGKVVGTAITAVAFPLLTVTVAVGKAVSWLMGRETSKFFTLKPTMHLYWSTVNLLVNNHAVNTGIFKKILDEEDKQRLGKPYKLDEEQMNDLSRLMPDVFNGNGYFDIYALANKAQRMANELFMTDFKMLDNGTSTDFEGYLKRDNSGTGAHTTYISDIKSQPTLAAFFNELLMFGDYYTAPDGAEVKQDIDPRVDPDAADGKQRTEGGYIDSFKKYADAEWRDGSQFAVFRVDHTGSVSESFGNSVAESDLAQKLNGISSQAREARFSFADGNLIGGAIGDVAGALTNLGMGALDGVTLGFAGLVPGLGGSGYIDIPKHWQSSSATLPRGSYTIQLISPYNNPISRMINIWIPFYMLLAGALPRSTGKQSYTSPFYCQIYDRGRLQSRLAMVESINITRGTSNLQFDTQGQVLALDVSLNIVDLSTIMHMPMSSGKLLETDITMDEDNIAADYLNVLAGMDIYSQIYPFPKAQLKMTKKLLAAKQKATSPAYHVSLFKNSVENGFINDITLGASGALSGLVSAPIAGASIFEGERF